MKFYVGVTDGDWFNFLAHQEPEAVNFWRPKSTTSFRAIREGAPLLFKYKYPSVYVVGGGFFVKHLILPLSLAGAPDYLQWNKIDYLAFIYNFGVINLFYNIYVMPLRWVKYLILTTGDYSRREIMR